MYSTANKQQEVEGLQKNKYAAAGGEEEEQEAEPATVSSPIASRTRNRTATRAQLSPRERKRRKAQGMKRDRQEKRVGAWDIKETEGGWRRARGDEAEMLDNLCEQEGEGSE